MSIVCNCPLTFFIQIRNDIKYIGYGYDWNVYYNTNYILEYILSKSFYIFFICRCWTDLTFFFWLKVGNVEIKSISWQYDRYEFHMYEYHMCILWKIGWDIQEKTIHVFNNFFKELVKTKVLIRTYISIKRKKNIFICIIVISEK